MAKVTERILLITTTLFLIFILNANKTFGQQDVWKSPGFYIGNQYSNKTLITTPQAWVNYGNTYFEARYNYEDTLTGSFYVGHEFDFDDTLNPLYNPHWTNCLIPMFGIVVGKTKGISLGLDYIYDHFTAIKIETENQYLLNWIDLKNNFFFDWTKLNYKIPFLTCLSLGGSCQFAIPKRAYPLNIGPMATIDFGSSLKFDAFVYNFWEIKPTLLLGIDFELK